MSTKLSSIKILADTEVYGNKAHWLSWLFSQGYNVPFALFFPAYEIKSSLENISKLESDKNFKNSINVFLNSPNNYSVAIRSSGTNEDSMKESKAGHFKSFIGDLSLVEIIYNMKRVVEASRPSEDEFNKMGVVIQKKINSKLSGVIFSSNVFNASKTECIISFTEGMGEQLVSGKIESQNIIISINNNHPDLSLIQTPIKDKNLTNLISITKQIESKCKFPVDIEWCVDSNEVLYILQCRPITSLDLNVRGIIEINLENEKIIPKEVVHQDKVSIRLFAQQNNIKISKAYLIALSLYDKNTVVELNKIQPEKYCTGFSVVSLIPQRIEGKIVRFFAEKEIDKKSVLYRSCQRYRIRTYENLSSIESTINKISDYCFQFSWLSISIIQEIFEAKYTGIIEKNEEGYFIELGRGHFIPKGVVPTSQYFLNENKDVLYKNEVIQPVYYNITQGNIKKIQYNKKITVASNILGILINSMKAIIDNRKTAIEFGIMFENKYPVPYLIDIVENSGLEISSTLLNEGVMSQGRISGKIVPINDTDKFSLNIHFHDENTNHYINKGKYVFLCSTPDIALLDIINTYYSRNIGFIFNSGSILSHLSIILRERKIPAIMSTDQDIVSFELVTIDATNNKIDKKERIKKCKGYVFSYINPDTDGVCTSLAFNSLYPAFTPVVFGEFDNETKYVLNFFNYNLPPKVSCIEKDSLMVIVDTHHIAQLPESINYENVIEIIDHHPSGDVERFPNAEIQNEEVGAACTLVAEKMRDKSITPSKELAGIIGLAIISNTLNFTAPSTSIKDKEIFKWLENYCDYSEDLIIGMFKARSDLLNVPKDELIKKNTKLFYFNEKTIGICQIEMINVEKLLNQFFIKELKEFKLLENIDYFFFSGLDIYSHQTLIKVIDTESKNLIENSMGLLFNTDNISVVNRILLRKTDFVPRIKEYLNP